jgi:hypothetical protein
VSPPVVWLSLAGLALLVAALAGVLARSWRAALFPTGAVLALAAVLGAVSFSRYQEFVTLVEMNPAISVADRLAYETHDNRSVPGRASAPTAGASGEESAQLPEPIGAEVKRLEERLYDWSGNEGRFSRRSYALARLQSLHHRMVYDFTIAEGFGVGRMFPRGVRRELIEIPDLPSVTAPESPPPNADETASLAAAGQQVADPASQPSGQADQETLRTAHKQEWSILPIAPVSAISPVGGRSSDFSRTASVRCPKLATRTRLGGGRSPAWNW